MTQREVIAKFKPYADKLYDYVLQQLRKDFDQYAKSNDYNGETFAESVHVRFLNNERAFRVVARNAGRSWWRSALTPKNGDTLSPFVALGARA